MKPDFLHFCFILVLVFFVYDASAQTAENRIAMGQYLTPSYQEYQLIPGVSQANCLYNPDIWNDNPYIMKHRTSGNWKNAAYLEESSDYITCEQIINSYKNYFTGYNPDEIYKK